MHTKNKRFDALALKKELEKIPTEKTLDEKIKHLSDVQRNDGGRIFVVQHTTLHKSSADGYLPGIQYFLNKSQSHYGKSTANVPDKSGLCPIHIAAERGQTDAVEFLSKNGHDIDTASSTGLTTLMYACKAGHAETVSKICSLGGNISATDMAGMTAAHFAAVGDHPGALEALYRAAEEKLNALLPPQLQQIQSQQSTASAPPSASPDPANTTSLQGTPTKPEGLPSILTKQGSKRAQLAHNRSQRKKQVVTTEVPKGKAIDVIDAPCRNGSRPIHLAAAVGAVKAIEYLVSVNVNLASVDSRGDTPLHRAGRNNHHEAYRLLVSAGSVDSVKNDNYESAAALLIDATL